MILDLGLIDYQSAYAAQRDLVRRRRMGQIGDSAVVLEHMPVFTLGRLARHDHLLIDAGSLRRLGIEAIRVDRGGDITYHGPGQIVLYPIVDLRVRAKDLHRYLRDLETVIIDFLTTYGIEGVRREGYAGVWIDPKRKIASVGVAASDWITYHGLSVNINNSLEPFSMIVPCGIKDAAMTSLKEMLGIEVDLAGAKKALVAAFVKRFGLCGVEDGSIAAALA